MFHAVHAFDLKPSVDLRNGASVESESDSFAALVAAPFCVFLPATKKVDESLYLNSHH